MKALDFYTIVFMLVVLPILAMQIRFLVYKRSQLAEHQKSLAEVLLDVIPHDLAIMGLTLGFAAMTMAMRTTVFPSVGPVSRYLLVFALMVPISIVSVIPAIRAPRLRVWFGALGYAAGAAAFLLATFQIAK